MRARNVIVALVIVAVLAIAGFSFLGAVYANTNGVAYDYRGVRGGSNANGGGDLLDTTAYVTAYSGGGSSEKIVIQGHARATKAFFSPSFERYWYKVSLTSDNSEVQINGQKVLAWTSATYTVVAFDSPTPWSDGAWTPLESVVLTLTNPCSGKIHVELWGHVNDLNIGSNDDGLLAVDEGYLRSGVGSVKVQNDVVEEGTTAHFFVETGYAHTAKTETPDGQGWTLNIYNPVGGSVFTKTIGDNFAGTVDWPVPLGSYSPSSTNIYLVKLTNELIDQDDDWFFTIGAGMMKQIPNQPSFKIVDPKDNYYAGDQITVQITATKNPIGNDIAGFWVWVSYETSAGTTTNYLIEKAWYPATKIGDGTQSTAQVTFTFPDAGNARFEASTADTLNLNSGIAELTWKIYKPGGKDKPPAEIDWLVVIVAIVAMIGAIIMGALLIIYAPKPYGIFVGVIVIFAGIAGGAIYLVGLV
jgi:hypothetical protein